MSLATKNVATVLVGLGLVLTMTFAFAAPAKADLLSDLQAQVQALLAQIAAMGGGSSTSGSGCFAFTMNQKMGDTGGEVMQIQKFLNSHGAVVSASGAGSVGNESSYFGAKTKAAVAAWQSMNGVSPASGFWGPLTRAKVASVCASAPSNPSNPSTGGETLNGSAGSANVSQTSEDVEDQVFTGTTEKVLGFKVEASGADVRVTNVRVKFTAAVDASASDRLSDYFSDISIWANGQKIASMAPSSFVRDSAGVYSASIPVSQVVRMGSGNKVTFHVGATAVSSVDSDNDGSTNDWSANLVQTRYTDPTGATLFDTTAGITNSGIYVDRLSSSSDVKLRMSEGSGNPKASNVEVSDSGTTEVTLAEFTLKAEGAAMEFDQLVASTTATGVTSNSDMVQNFYLMRGSTRLDEVAASGATGQVVTFSLDNTETIAQDATQTYKIVAKLNKIGTGAFSNGDSLTASTSPGVGQINAKSTSDGKTVTNRSGSVTTYTQTFYSSGIMVQKVGESFTHNANATTPSSSTGEYKVTLRVTAFGSDDVYIPLNSTASSTAEVGTTGVSYGILNSSNVATSTTGASSFSATVTRVSGGTEQTNSIKIGAGSSADIMVTIVYNPAASSAAQFRAQIWGVGSAASDSSTATTFTATTPVGDFRTGFYTINN